MNDSQKRYGLLGPAIGVAYCILLAGFATLLGTWTDEEYTLATTAHGVLYAWHRAIDFELQAPLYFAAVALWREINASVWFARLFSVLSVTGFFFALVPLLRRVAPDREPLWPALLIAFNPFVIYCAFDIRLYAASLLISTLGYLTFEAGFASGSSARARVCFVLLYVAGLYTQYFLGFALVGYAALLLVKGRRSAFLPYIYSMVAVGVAAIPILGILHSQIGGSGETAASVSELLRTVLLHPWLDFVLPREPTTEGFHLRLPYTALLIAIAILLIYARPAIRVGLRGALVCAVCIDLMYLAVVLVFHLDLNIRHYVVLFVPLLVAGYLLIGELARSRLPQAATALASAYAFVSLGATFLQQHHVAETGDSKRVAAYLETHAVRGAVVAVYPADAVPAYERQYHGLARLIPFPKALSTSRYDVDGITVHDEQEAVSALKALGEAPQYWVVMLGACDNGAHSYGCNYVLAAVHDASDVISERRFYDNRVFELLPRK